MKSSFLMAAVAVAVFTLATGSTQAGFFVTDFGSSGGGNTLTDGRDAGFSDLGAHTEADTADGWTWYTENSTTNDNLTVIFGGGTETLGEQELRSGNNVEYATNDIFFGWGLPNLALALRSPTYSVLVAGNANVDWTADNANLKVYYSQDGGASWTATTDAADFAVAAGTLEVVFVGNDGNDSNTRLDAVTVTTPTAAIPEPGTAAALGLMGLALLVRRRK